MQKTFGLNFKRYSITLKSVLDRWLISLKEKHESTRINMNRIKYPL